MSEAAALQLLWQVEEWEGRVLRLRLLYSSACSSRARVVSAFSWFDGSFGAGAHSIAASSWARSSSSEYDIATSVTPIVPTWTDGARVRRRRARSAHRALYSQWPTPSRPPPPRCPTSRRRPLLPTRPTSSTGIPHNLRRRSRSVRQNNKNKLRERACSPACACGVPIAGDAHPPARRDKSQPRVRSARPDGAARAHTLSARRSTRFADGGAYQWHASSGGRRVSTIVASHNCKKNKL